MDILLKFLLEFTFKAYNHENSVLNLDIAFLKNTS